MKKTIVLAGAAALALVACNKSQTVVEQAAPGELTFKAVSSNVTKGAELTGTVMPNTYAIYAAATQKNASGSIENPKFFTGTEQLFGTDVATPVASTPWKAGSFSGATFTPSPIYWPLGGVKMDFLAYAMPQADHNTIASDGSAAADWTAFWNNANTDAASMLSFNGVDTYANQVDVLYAVANDRTSANSGATDYIPMTFKHAQALLIFNIKRNDLTPLPALKIKEIAFYTPARVEAIRADQVAVAGGASSTLAALADADVTLKTVGTFTVDNSHNTLLAGWTYGAAWADSHKKAHFAMPDGVTGKSESNLAAVSGVVDYNNAVVYNANYVQLGETLLIPEQEKVNFTMTYTLGGNTYTYTYNDLRGVWEKGKKYIYNIDIALQEIIITENVVDFVETTTDVPLS